MGRITLSFESGKTDDCAYCKLYYLCKSKDDMMTQYGLDCNKYDFSKMEVSKSKEEYIMINNNELMLGNYVNYYTSPTKVIQISDDIITCIVDNHKLYLKNTIIEPIPITEEILEKCGFEKTYDDNGFCKFHKVENSFIEVFIYKYNDSLFRIGKTDANIEIKYLHQLQNSYFILTGEKLNIEL